ncbi:FUSC family protein OS=Streptomyces tendae OX=1932 GN=GUR47_28935 PE=4 SV=1 [Streptomyces tendae]
MALLVAGFAGCRAPGRRMTERAVDSGRRGRLVGFQVAVVVTNRRAGNRVEQAVPPADRVRELRRAPARRARAPAGALEAARRGRAAGLTDPRATGDGRGRRTVGARGAPGGGS